MLSGPTAEADSPRARLLAGVPADLTSRGVWVLDPDAPEYPGSAFDALLPTTSGGLLVEAPAGPVALLGSLAADAELDPRVTDLTVAGERTAVLAPLDRLEQVVDDASDPGTLRGPLARLAGTTAPLAWAGTVGDDVEALVELTGDRVRAELRGGDAGRLAERTRTALAGALPGSPGKRWSDLLADVEVAVEGDAAVVTARTTALPPELLRTIVDRASGGL